MSRLLVVDASISNRLVRELNDRGRRATSTEQLGMGRLLDDPLRKRLASRSEAWVLVAADDRMPAEHGDMIAETRATVATIAGSWEVFCACHDLSMTQEQFKRDSIHRWAHVMSEQKTGEIRRYTPLSHAVWKPRRRW